MLFTKTKLKEAHIIELEKIEDERGFFARTWDIEKFKNIGLNPKIVQCNMSLSKQKGIIRGMHYQLEPHQETKFVRCTKGAIYDVIIDLRKDSETFRQWLGVELTENNYRMLYVPEGFAHGFQTLESDTEVFYQVSEAYYPELERGVRWDDPAFEISWPLEEKIISKKDMSHPNFIY